MVTVGSVLGLHGYKDKAIMGLIDNGEEWLEPLLNFRNMLAETQDKEKKPIYRDYKRMNGKLSISGTEAANSSEDHISLNIVNVLRKLLETQRESRRLVQPQPSTDPTRGVA